MKKSINQIRDEIKTKYEHLFKLIKSCETSEQLETVQKLRDEYTSQLRRMINENSPLLFGVKEYDENTRQALRCYDDKYWNLNFEKLNQF